MGVFDFNELERDDPVLGLELWVANVQSRKNTFADCIYVQGRGLFPKGKSFLSRFCL